jgi:hypothetical protein
MIKTGKKKLSKNRMIAVLDKACRQRTVIDRDHNTCQRCGKQDGEWDPEVRRPTVIQWSHIKGRRYLALRWDDDNSLAHCDRCHTWFTHNHILGLDWFSKKFPERWERIKRVLEACPQTKDADIRARVEELRA